jgi:glucosylglycerate synthase
MDHAAPGAEARPDAGTDAGQPGAADLAIGVMTAARSAAAHGVAKMAQEAMLTHWAGLTAALIVVDPTLPDEQARRTERIADGVRLVHARPDHAVPAGAEGGGWSEAVRTVLAISRSLSTRAVVMLNADVSSMTSEWINGLAHPVLKEGYAFVLPVYQRARYEGTLTRLLVMPLLRALFGHQLWHPIADEFGCSGEAAKLILAEDVWATDLARQGLEFWLSVAVAGGALPLAQSVLGPRILAPGRPPPPLGSIVGRVAGALFTIAERHETAWLDVRGSEPVAVFGVPPEPATRAPAIDPERMLAGFRQGVRDLLPIWERILSPESLGDVLVLSEHPAGEFRLADRVWARVVYDFLLAYRTRVMYQDHITQSLAPLYLGCAASLVLETSGRPDEAVAQAAERLARAFEDEKQYLVDRWR